jgi:Pyruvate/2-oxoacid:ferredoxin oxidoreductase delta subunit
VFPCGYCFQCDNCFGVCPDDAAEKSTTHRYQFDDDAADSSGNGQIAQPARG